MRLSLIFPMILLVCSCAAPESAIEPDPEIVPDGPVQFEPAPLARLTATQYRNALDDLFDGVTPVALQADTNPYLFTNIGAATTSLSEDGVQLLEEAATQVSAEVFKDRQRRVALVGCEPTSVTDPCVDSFIADFGLRTYRRPLTDTETERWLDVVARTSGGDPWQGLRSAVAGMLQSPHMVYRVEVGEPDREDPTRRVLSDFEIASRLSFLLWNSPPDAELLLAASRGELATPEGIEVQARRLLEDERARVAIADFFDQYLNLSRLEHATPDAATFPGWSESLRAAMRAEVRLLVDDVVSRQDTDVRNIFSTRRTYVNSDLARHYGVNAEDVTPITFAPIELPDSGPRAGILTSGAFLTMNAHPIETSPTSRGKYIIERILCQLVPPPPDDVDLEIPASSGEAKTLRERLELHRAEPECANCHKLFDPTGYLFEHFDAVGAWRSTDDGHPIDTSGGLWGSPLDGARGLAEALGTHERVGVCMAQQTFRHAHSRLNTPKDDVSLTQIHREFEASGFRFRELLVAITTHDSFRYVDHPVEAQ
ncbi:MAG: DUF1592 domain-containing protein [Myxococcota bacterium]